MSTPDLNNAGYNQDLHKSSPIPPPAPLDLPEPTSPRFIPQSNVSRSPLRNSITMDLVTGSISQDGSPNPIDEHDPWGTRDHQMSHSPTPSITKFASSFAQRVGSLVSSVSPSSQSVPLPTEAEIEAEAASQRDRSRREAERILTQEAMERKRVEERVLEMLDSSRTRPTRSQTTPLPDPPSPSPTSKEGGTNWWTAAKNRLTKDKELTPAQQVIAETKAKEKEKRKSKDYKDWPANGAIRYPEPYQQSSLSLPPGARPPGGFVGSGANVIPSSASMSSAPLPQQTRNATPRTPSPSRSAPMHHNNGSSTNMFQHPDASPAFSTASSNKDAVPVYAQFTSQGDLDVSATLLTIARRFEKLERWAVGHVRALEDRMNDVEQWLVDKERERERERPGSKNSAVSDIAAESGTSSAGKVVREVTIERVEVDHEVKREVGEMKDELGELRSRVGELGREMARLSTATINGSRSETPSEVGFGIGRLGSPGMTGSNPGTPIVVSDPRTLPSIPAQRDRPQSPSHSIAHSETASIISTTSTMTRTKLPYPTGDYTSPSPPSSPPPRQIIATPTGSNLGSGFSRSRAMPYSSRPMSPSQSPMTGAGRSPAQNAVASSSGSPSVGAPTRPVGTNSNPRKRYTVALGQPLSSSPNVSYSAEEPEEKKSMFDDDLFSEPPKVELQTAFFSNVKAGDDEKEGDDQDEDRATIKNEENQEGTESGAGLSRRETIGKTPINLSSLSTSPPPSQTSSPNRNPGLQRGSPMVSSSSRRVRTQSTYGVPGSSPSSVSNGPRVGTADTNAKVSAPSHNAQTDIDPKGSWRSRSKSIDRFGDIGVESGSTFVDPLVIRKKEKATAGSRNSVVGSPVTRGRVPFGDLLAFFDAEKQSRSAAL